MLLHNSFELHSSSREKAIRKISIFYSFCTSSNVIHLHQGIIYNIWRKGIITCEKREFPICGNLAKRKCECRIKPRYSLTFYQKVGICYIINIIFFIVCPSILLMAHSKWAIILLALFIVISLLEYTLDDTLSNKYHLAHFLTKTIQERAIGIHMSQFQELDIDEFHVRPTSFS